MVRTEQSQALRAVYFEELEDRTVSILAQWFPDEYERTGESGAREHIRQGARRAEALGAVTEVDLGKYITMEFALGEGVMSELVASVRERRSARDASCKGSAFIEAVCRAGLVQLEREQNLTSDEED